VQENDRVPAANGYITHLAVADVHATAGMIVFDNNPVMHGIVPLAIRCAPGNGGPELVAIPEINSALPSRFYPLSRPGTHTSRHDCTESNAEVE
jgi:hypothetical protein